MRMVSGCTLKDSAIDSHACNEFNEYTVSLYCFGDMRYLDRAHPDTVGRYCMKYDRSVSKASGLLIAHSTRLEL